MAADRTVVLVNARGGRAGSPWRRGAVIGPPDADGRDRIDLGGATVIPGLVDAHVHFPSWALGLRELRLFGTRSLSEALERIEAAEKPARGLAARARLARGGVAGGRAADAGGAGRGDRRGPDRAARARRAHAVGEQRARCAAAGARRPERTSDGILREQDAWDFFDTFAAASPQETLDAVRAALPVAHAAGVTGVHDKDGARGAPEAFAALREAGELTLRVWQSVPNADADARQLREGVHGRHARLAHRAAARRRRDAADGAGGARRGRPRGRGGRDAGRGARDRRPRQPRGARRLRGDRGRVAPARAAPPRRARAVHPRRRHRPLRAARHHRLGPVQPRHQRPRARRAAVGRPPRPRLPLPAAARRRRPPRRRLGRAGRGARPARRPARRRGVRRDPRRGARLLHRRARLARGRRGPPRPALTRLRRRPRRARRRPRARDDGRRALGPRSAARVRPARLLERRRHPLRARADPLAQRPHVGGELGLLRRLLEAETDTSCERTVSSSTRIRSISPKKRSSCFSIRRSVASCVPSASIELRLRRRRARTCASRASTRVRRRVRRAPRTAAARAPRSTPSPPRSGRSPRATSS